MVLLPTRPRASKLTGAAREFERSANFPSATYNKDLIRDYGPESRRGAGNPATGHMRTCIL